MRKSSIGGGRPSVSGIPSRVKKGDAAGPSTTRKRSKSTDRASTGAGPSAHRSRPSEHGSSGYAGRQSFQRPRQMSMGRGGQADRLSFGQSSFLPRSGRPSSGIGVRGRTDVPKDSRPISDKRYQRQCIANCVEFLMSRKYPLPLSTKLLSSPSNNDFSAIFQFIMDQMWFGFKLKNKISEEVPQVLKLIGYPFNLPKTYLFSVGSPHTWPHLLAVLQWMIELVQAQEAIALTIDAHMFEPTDGEDFDGIPIEKILSDYKEKTFAAFLSGKDEYPEENEELKRVLMEKYHCGNVDDHRDQNRRLLAELEERKRVEEEAKRLRQQVKQDEQDVQSHKEYSDKLIQHKQSLEAQMERKREELKLVESDLQQEQGRLHKLRQQYEAQDLKPADVERMKAEQEQLNNQVEQEEKRLNDITSEIWQLNMDQAKKNEELQEIVAKYNRLAIALKIVPECAEFADGKDFRLGSGVTSDVVREFEDNIKPKLTLMKKSLNEQYRIKKKEQLGQTCDLEKMQDGVMEMKRQLEQKEKELAQIEADIKALVQEADQDHRMTDEEMSNLKQDVAEREVELKKAKAEKQRAAEELATVQKAFELKVKEAEKEALEIKKASELMEKTFAEHKENVKAQMRAWVKKIEEADIDATRQLKETISYSNKMRKKLKLPLRDAETGQLADDMGAE